MKKNKKRHRLRALDEDTMLVYLKTISFLKRKVSIGEIVGKIQFKYPSRRPSRIHNTLIHLHKDGYIHLERKIYPSLTQKGVLYLESILQKQKTHWDHRFRIVLSDRIQTSKNNLIYIRTRLTQYGFMNFCRGVWVYPYACDAFVKLLQLEYALRTPITFLVAQDNETLTHIRKNFRLR